MISCYDRLIIKGTLSSVGYDRAIEQHLHNEGVKLKDCQQWVASKRDEAKANAVRLTQAAGVQIEHIRSSKSDLKPLLDELSRLKPCIPERI